MHAPPGPTFKKIAQKFFLIEIAPPGWKVCFFLLFRNYLEFCFLLSMAFSVIRHPFVKPGGAHHRYVMQFRVF